MTLIPFDLPVSRMTIDTETTGLDPDLGDEILTLAMVLDVEGRAAPSHVHLRVRPERRREWPSAERVNGISSESVRNLKPFSAYREAVQSLFDRAEVIVGWNVGFDLNFLEHEGIAIGPHCEIVDAMDAFGCAFGPAHSGHSRWRRSRAFLWCKRKGTVGAPVS